MPLEPGTSLGHYDVTALIGEGGMGQVCDPADMQIGSMRILGRKGCDEGTGHGNRD